VRERGRAFNSRRWTTASRKPFSRRNSERWKPSGSFWADGLLDNSRAGKADQSAGFGYVQVAEHGETGGDSASGGIGEDAMYGTLASSNCARAVEIFASCMRLTTPSIMRAPRRQL